MKDRNVINITKGPTGKPCQWLSWSCILVLCSLWSEWWSWVSWPSVLKKASASGKACRKPVATKIPPPAMLTKDKNLRNLFAFMHPHLLIISAKKVNINPSTNSMVANPIFQLRRQLFVVQYLVPLWWSWWWSWSWWWDWLEATVPATCEMKLIS